MNGYVPVEWLVHPEIFGIRLRARRRDLRMSMHDLASLTGIAPNIISMLERGHRRPNGETLVRLAEACGLIQEVQPPAPKPIIRLTLARRVWRITRKGWLWLSALLGLPASILGIWAFLRDWPT